MSLRIRRVGRSFRVERNAGRGQIIPVASFTTRRDAEAAIEQLNAVVERRKAMLRGPSIL